MTAVSPTLDSSPAAATSAPAPPAEPRRYTYDELVAEMPETNQPSELWDGELIMSPAPFFEHQKTSLALYRRLHDWVGDHGLGEVVAAPIDMVLSARRAVQPDVLYVSVDRLDIIRGAIRGPADLVAEVISPGGRHRDRIEKRDLYEQYGVKEYWIVDPEATTIEVLFLEAQQYVFVGRTRPGETAESRLLPGFCVPVKDLFATEAR